MLKDITTLKMAGANFDSLTSFNFFNPHDGDKTKVVKATLLYGKNGSGKSTIAKAFRKLAGETIPTITSAAFYDDTNQPVIITEEERKHIFIYDEDYVDKNVRLKQDHLDTIVMLGPIADLSGKIERAEEECKAAKAAYDQQEMKLREYTDSTNVKAPQYYINQLCASLKGDDNWADRDRRINGARQKQNSTVKNDTYKQFVGIVPSKSKTDLLLEFEEKEKELQAAQSGALVINTNVPTLPSSILSFEDGTVKQLLLTKIEKPILSEREKKLIELKVEELSERQQIFQNKETRQCPYCFQNVTPAYKESLVESIEKILSKTVEDHKESLRSFLLEPLNYDMACFDKLNNYQDCIDLIEDLNKAIQESNNIINEKIANPYDPIDNGKTKIKKLAKRLDIALKKLEETRKEYNENSKKTSHIISELKRINGEIAHYDVADLSMRLDKQKAEYNLAKELFDSLKKDWIAKKNLLDDLEAQRKNIRLAIDSINACLKYIFFTEDRLNIEYIDGVYKLQSRGKSVKPCDVSVGERNIIGLSYFFTSIFEGKEEKDTYNTEILLVIDDPVSSYDFENRIGILSFIRYKLSAFLEGNQNTKALVMTHDLSTFYDVHKILEEIIDSCKTKGYPHMPKFNCYEIIDNSLELFSYKFRHEYTELIKEIYEYACGNETGYELVIGNVMRQTLEAFSTFEYKKNIEKVSTDEQILQILPKLEHRKYFRNLMYRLVLHGGSHREEQIKSMTDFRFFNHISEKEKRRTAKDILCFIYLLNQKHLTEHLKDFPNAATDIATWCQEIETQTTT